MERNNALIIFGVVVVVAGLLAVMQRVMPEPERSAVPMDSVNYAILEPACVASGGVWNECGSSCRGLDAEFCLQVCVKQCECQADEDCPFGYGCSDMIEDVGICKKSL